MHRRMPVMNGDEATQRLRAAGCELPIIGITGDAHSDDFQLFAQSGVTQVCMCAS